MQICKYDFTFNYKINYFSTIVLDLKMPVGYKYLVHYTFDNNITGL